MKGIDNSDYLVKAGTIDQKRLDEDSLELYDDILNGDLDEYTKQIISIYYRPFEISILKYMLNREYLYDPNPIDLRHGHSQIAPSLKIIKENWISHNAPGYPSWFYMVFPDVAIWAIKGDGKKLIIKKFRKLNESEFIENKQIKGEYLIEIIKLYKSKTGNTLECAIY